MRRIIDALPVVGAFVIAVAIGGISVRFLSSPQTPPAPVRTYPRAEILPEWARQVLVAKAADGQVIYEQGVNNVPACATCHGVAGMPEPLAPYPRLAGQSADYIAKQLDDYATDIRHNEQMQSIARALNAGQRAAVARYSASLPPVQTLLSAATLEERGRTLDEVGNNEQAIPACGNCHGLRGRGEGIMLPPLAGQPEAYLVSQLNAFRQRRRHNDTVEVMEGIASRLSDTDVNALARYFSALHPEQVTAR